ncbi:hypothetical protein COU89_01450 [Candidatus Roizmanbacteria bacterium CG10_big_fil_rev_8_21_14_0_10_45_7]|uniref:HAD family hydrolase n=1 Tax=Candidatus Roizmanbacteria bacterium CG10_big_fil_rev_8_21_14_0_10_45_7 TaxID=1974854 RepID=A0A2M8KV02_9BACT|nr:MAG: hypothetical protein COU89_01450 [Candidatus Roizmanbacteria bacterium CG10_big_fil_rev_8_21_14_0_10_45_7]
MKKIIIFDFAGTLVCMRPVKLLVPYLLLAILSKFFVLGIITGANRRNTMRILNKVGIANFFSDKAIITKDDVSYSKPDIRLINFFARRLSSKEIFLYVGDSDKDFKMAKRYGVNFLCYNSVNGT